MVRVILRSAIFSRPIGVPVSFCGSLPGISREVVRFRVPLRDDGISPWKMICTDSLTSILPSSTIPLQGFQVTPSSMENWGLIRGNVPVRITFSGVEGPGFLTFTLKVKLCPAWTLGGVSIFTWSCVELVNKRTLV
ncbi:hypothetical protein DSECCO2_155580 [anaerobic digester metagenome]